jgi:hypothetical protein
MNKITTLATASLWLVTAMAQAALPQPLPASIALNVAAVQAACADVRHDAFQVDISRATNDSAGVSSGLTTLRADRAALQAAQEVLATAVRAYMKPARDAVDVAETAYESAFTQLRADVIGNPGAVTADKTKLLSAYATLEATQAQVQANLQALAGAGALGRCAGGAGMGNRVSGGESGGSGAGAGSVGNMGGSRGMGRGGMQ